MTTVLAEHSLSNVELVVLARLSSWSAPKNKELTEAVKAFASIAEHEVNDETTKALQRLVAQGLADDDRKLTDTGRRLLVRTCGLEAQVTWATIRDKHLPALAFGVKPGSAEAEKMLTRAQDTALILQMKHFGVSSEKALEQIADRALEVLIGMTPTTRPLTMKVLRSHALAFKISGTRSTAKRSLLSVVSQATLGAPATDKDSLARALGRHWFYEVTKSRHVQAGPRSPDSAAAQSTLSIPPTPHANTKPRPATPPSGKSSGAEPAHAPEPSERLLTLVREAIPRIGSDGRFGSEKVFVSAIWHRIERDPRLPDLSLDRFKQWLVTANRDQLVDLARADLVGAMDPKLVAESEIEDLGATFHFVVDRRTTSPGSEPRTHAR